MKKVYEHCPGCGKKGLYLTGPKSWTTMFVGEPVKCCRYCSYMERPGKG